MIAGKIHAAKVLFGLYRHCSNWREIWSKYRRAQPLPAFELSSGLRIVHDKHDDMISLYREIFLRHVYTGSKFYRPTAGDVVMDAGANIGTFAIYLQHCARGIQIHSFEPAQETRAKLVHNIRSNQLSDFVHIHPYGLSGHAQRLTLHGNQSSGSRSTLATAAHTTSESEEIDCITLTDAIARVGTGSIALLKIDIEGAEVDLLCDETPETWQRIERVALKFHGSLRKDARQSVEASLRKLGYAIIAVRDHTRDGQDGTLQAVRRK